MPGKIVTGPVFPEHSSRERIWVGHADKNAPLGRDYPLRLAQGAHWIGEVFEGVREYDKIELVVLVVGLPELPAECLSAERLGQDLAGFGRDFCPEKLRVEVRKSIEQQAVAEPHLEHACGLSAKSEESAVIDQGLQKRAPSNGKGEDGDPAYEVPDSRRWSWRGPMRATLGLSSVWFPNQAIAAEYPELKPLLQTGRFVHNGLANRLEISRVVLVWIQKANALICWPGVEEEDATLRAPDKREFRRIAAESWGFALHEHLAIFSAADTARTLLERQGACAGHCVLAHLARIRPAWRENGRTLSATKIPSGAGLRRAP